MKSISISIFVLLLIIGCNDSIIKPGGPITLENLYLGSALNWLPVSLLQNGSAAIFVNALGQEKRLNIFYEKEMKPASMQGISYQREQITVSYIDADENLNYYKPIIIVQATYDNLTDSHQFLSASVQSSFNSGFIPHIGLKNQFEPELGSRQDSLEIANLEFYKVFESYIDKPEFTSFSRVYYTCEQGIVGFEGEDEEIWALLRIE